MRIRRSTFYKKFLAVIFIALSFTARIEAQTGIDAGLADALQHSIDSMQAAFNVKGISAAAYIPGKGMWKGVTGVSYGTLPIDTTMLMSIGSVTKTFIAAEILKMTEAGLISLTDTIGGILPAMPNVNGGITIKQLLSHTSGMGEYLNTSWQSGMAADYTAMWYYPVAFSAFSTPAAGAPGSPFHYCNSNYVLLGMIIEAKKSDSLHRVLRNDFLTPYHLDNTHMEIYEPYSNIIADNWSTPTLNPALAVDAAGTPHQALWTSTEPAGGYFSSPADLAMWGYNLYSGNVISTASLSQMLTLVPASGGYFDGYGLGVMRFPWIGKIYYGHGGNFFGYAASMIYYPVDSICVAVLINQDCIATYEARALMDILIKKLAAGVREVALKDNITLSPNPANTALTISIPGNKDNVQIAIVDAAGKDIYQTDMPTGTISINTSDFTAGAYFIKITSGGSAVTKRVIVEH